MATYTSRTVEIMHHEWLIPMNDSWGAAAAEVSKAWSAAEQAYRLHHKITDAKSVCDDALTFHADDEHIIIRFTTENE